MNTVPPASRPNFQQRSDPMYRPGGTSEYVPAARSQGAAADRRATNLPVTPAGYNNADAQNCPGGICPDRRYQDSAIPTTP
jgi:hypothetical protein